MNNVLYVTSDKPEQPIINSQVLPLINGLRNYTITLAMKSKKDKNRL